MEARPWRNASHHCHLPEHPSVLSYARGGLNIAKISNGAESSDIGLKLGGGIRFPLERKSPLVEARAVISQLAMNIAAQHDSIDVIVLDAVLPDSWGPRLSADLCWIRPTVELVSISGKSREVDMLEASRTDKVPFLEKPFSVSELRDTIEGLINSPTD